MTYLLDTNVCIRIINGRSAAARQKLLSHPVENKLSFAVSSGLSCFLWRIEKPDARSDTAQDLFPKAVCVAVIRRFRGKYVRANSRRTGIDRYVDWPIGSANCRDWAHTLSHPRHSQYPRV